MSDVESKQDKVKDEVVDRKIEGLKLTLTRPVEARENSTFLEYVHLIHNALPELNFEEIDTSVEFFKHSFSAPLFIESMTGGTAAATEINANLASVAEELKLGMGVGSQRAGLKSEALAETYSIARKNAPTAFLAANIGGAQLAKGLGLEEVQRLVDMIQADALTVHLNPLQELIQPEGEPQFKGVLAKIEELASKLKVPIIVKEVGAGISREVAIRLQLAGVAAINVSGAGGTSWAGVESYRAKEGSFESKAELGNLFWDWGIPTAAALIEVRRAVKLPVIASGGLRNGLDVAKSIVLGADLCGMALPFLKKAAVSRSELMKFAQKTILELKSTMFVVGAANIPQLKRARCVVTGPLFEWLSQLLQPLSGLR